MYRPYPYTEFYFKICHIFVTYTYYENETIYFSRGARSSGNHKKVHNNYIEHVFSCLTSKIILSR